MPTNSASTRDRSAGAVLIPDPHVAKRVGRSLRTLARWDRDPTLGFPTPVRINGLKYRDAAAFEAWLQGFKPST